MDCRGQSDMGNKHSGSGKLHNGLPKYSASKFDDDELWVLKQTWQDMADRNDGRGIDKETFLQYFPLHGLLGERMFVSFDRKKTGFIDFDDFVIALAVMARGNLDQKIHFLFDMCDVLKEGTVSKAELETFLNHVPTEILHCGTHAIPADNARSTSGGESPVAQGEDSKADESARVSLKNATDAAHPPPQGGEGNDSDEEYEEEVDAYTNHDIVMDAFNTCDVEHDGRLTYEEFKMWVERTPVVLEYIESIVPYAGVKDNHKHTNKEDALPLHYKEHHKLDRMERSSSYNSLKPEDMDFDSEITSISEKIPSSSSGASTFKKLVRQNSRGRASIGAGAGQSGTPRDGPTATGGESDIHNLAITRQKSVGANFRVPDSPKPEIPEVLADKSNSEDVAMIHLEAAMRATQSEDMKKAISELIEYMSHHAPDDHVEDLTPSPKMSTPRDDEVVSHQGFLWKKGSHFSRWWSKRYYVLSGSCVYYYANVSDVRPKHVIFLTGSVVEKVMDVVLETKGYFGFEITHMNMVNGDHHKHDTRLLYTRSEEEREKWVTVLQQAAHVVPITDHYVIASELGRGRFSVVHECVNKKTREHLAVKIIDKNTVKPDEKALLRTEIAVLKLMHHPHIIRMDGLYETKDKVYIVMEMLKGGELFERIVGRPRFSECDTAKLLRPLLESVAYMHDLGIVHRDIKPENILCGENLESVKIADFGLSKMIMPNEKMVQACGTLSYVAPEVLTNQGYGKEADMWSVGVIMFLLLCGKLPFDGGDASEIIKKTIQGDLKVSPAIWNKLSDEAKSLLTSLLNKSCKRRITARHALKHPFLLMYAPPEVAAKRRYTRHSIVASAAVGAAASSTATSETISAPAPLVSPVTKEPDSGKESASSTIPMAAPAAADSLSSPE